MRMTKKPWKRSEPEQYTPSFAELGIVAQEGCLIELRAPDPAVGGYWQRVYLTPDAAARLLEWLPDAIAMQSPKAAEARDA